MKIIPLEIFGIPNRRRQREKWTADQQQQVFPNLRADFLAQAVNLKRMAETQTATLTFESTEGAREHRKVMMLISGWRKRVAKTVPKLQKIVTSSKITYLIFFAHFCRAGDNSKISKHCGTVTKIYEENKDWTTSRWGFALPSKRKKREGTGIRLRSKQATTVT